LEEVEENYGNYYCMVVGGGESGVEPEEIKAMSKFQVW
jgi:hypothetical protein